VGIAHPITAAAVGSDFDMDTVAASFAAHRASRTSLAYGFAVAIKFDWLRREPMFACA